MSENPGTNANNANHFSRAFLNNTFIKEECIEIYSVFFREYC